MRGYQEVRPTSCMYTMMARDKLKKKVVVADSGWWACGEDLPPCETAASRVLVKVKASFV